MKTYLLKDKKNKVDNIDEYVEIVEMLNSCKKKYESNKKSKKQLEYEFDDIFGESKV